MYMMWFCDNPKVSQTQKITEAVAAYVRHFKTQPNIALVHTTEVVSEACIPVRGVSYVRKNNIWVGWEGE